MEIKCNVGAKPQIIGYQVETRRNNRSVKTKLSNRAKKNERAVKIEIKVVSRWNKALKNLRITPNSQNVCGEKGAKDKQQWIC